MANDQALAKLLLEVVPHTMHGIRREMRELAKNELTVAQLRTLAHLHNGLNTTSDIAEYLGVSMPAMSKMIDILSLRGLVTRETNPEDRRHIHLTLTSAGTKVFLNVRKASQHRVSEQIKNLTGKRKRNLASRSRNPGKSVPWPRKVKFICSPELQDLLARGSQKTAKSGEFD